MTGGNSPPLHLDSQAPTPVRRRHPDASALFGLVAGFTLLALAIQLGGSPAFFVDVPSMLIVFGGTFSVVAICYSFRDLGEAARAVWTAIADPAVDPQTMAVGMLQVAEHARRFGPLALQDLERPIAGSPFLDKAVTLAVDGLAEPAIEASLRSDLQASLDSSRHTAGVLRKAAEVAPAIGLIGTLVGLVQMLRSLDTPATMGPSMAVALLTTFYGAILGHMIFTPLAAKLDRRAASETLTRQLCILTALSISRRENPRLLEQALNNSLPPRKRIKIFD
jgi:Flagellar motor component